MSRPRAAAYLLSGKDPDPLLTRGHGIDSFQRYLEVHGIRYFTGREYTMPRMTGVHPDELLPPRSWWPRALVPILLADRERRASGAPISLRRGYNDNRVNDLRGGAPASDHLTAHAIDLDFMSMRLRDDAVRRLIPLWDSGIFEMSLGIYRGSRSLHLGCFSPKGQRVWDGTKVRRRHPSECLP